MTGAGTIYVLAMAGGASLAFILFLSSVLRNPPGLRRARAFLAFRGYVRLWHVMAPALAGASCLLLYILWADPEAVDAADWLFYVFSQGIISLAFIHSFWQGARG